MNAPHVAATFPSRPKVSCRGRRPGSGLTSFRCRTSDARSRAARPRPVADRNSAVATGVLASADAQPVRPARLDGCSATRTGARARICAVADSAADRGDRHREFPLHQSRRPVPAVAVQILLRARAAAGPGGCSPSPRPRKLPTRRFRRQSRLAPSIDKIRPIARPAVGRARCRRPSSTRRRMSSSPAGSKTHRPFGGPA